MGPQQGGTHVHVTCSMALTPEHMPRRFEPSTRPLNGACAAPVHACAPRQTLTLSPSLISQPSTAQPLADGNRRSSGVAAARLPQHPRQARPPLSRARGRIQSVASPRQARPPPSRARGRTQSVARGNRTPQPSPPAPEASKATAQQSKRPHTERSQPEASEATAQQGKRPHSERSQRQSDPPLSTLHHTSQPYPCPQPTRRAQPAPTRRRAQPASAHVTKRPARLCDHAASPPLPTSRKPSPPLPRADRCP